MVDWATQDRLYPHGYQPVDIRYRRISIDSSLPYSIALNKRHNCRSQSKQSRIFKSENIFNENLHHGLYSAIYFFNNISKKSNNDRNPKLLASYSSNINWPRSICCLSKTDGSLIICEQDQCRLLLFTSKLILRSTCGEKRGNGLYEFDSPWSVAALIDKSSSNILVADTNNRRIQFFTIEYNGQFLHQHSLIIKEKPYFIATSKRHFAVSCEKNLIITFLANERTKVANINLKKISLIQNSNEIAFCLCMDPESSLIFVSNPIAPSNVIHQLTINGEYLRSIKLDHKPFLHISSLTFDAHNQQLIIADSLNSIIYSVEHDLDEDNVEILLKRSDNVNYPQDLCISNEGHLIVVECSVLTQHALKIFRYHPCVCHSRLTTSSVKTSETTSVRSIIYQY
ncbi:unnamed protein product [Rotaria sp. Silwood1]|nr:unnamed protein product [Rotaria sp. Silwood1]CAF0867803.1 unnamed protein product [Rotaria sp. Silwood1]CAF3389233.1 unnamed protein product [Rotaria sp. Silwood1]CAF3389537.1 unnamed protein product [Rotaria sp. Silwood1]CAF4713054.1 unnamed protein product [Rotaria sp. Silwood1]